MVTGYGWGRFLLVCGALLAPLGSAGASRLPARPVPLPTLMSRIAPEATAYTPDRVLVRWRTAPPPQRAFRFRVLRTHTPSNTSTVQVPAGSSVEATLYALRSDPRVLYAAPNVRRRILTLPAPNEPTWGKTDPQPDYTTRSMATDVPPDYQQDYMWALEQIQALDAWNVYPGVYYTAQTKLANPVKVAVLDTGCDISHPDWINAGGTSPDIAHGGQLDISEAASFLNGNTTPQPLTDDPVGHGTFTAGIVGAAANNGGPTNPLGGAIGLGYALQVLPVQVLNSADSGSVDDEIHGIYYAVDHGAQVISLSLGDFTYSPFEQDAVDYAWNHNVLVVAAAGNDRLDPNTGGPGPNRPMYPAADNHVLAVGATGLDDNVASYSNTGNYVGISAPGGDLYDVGLDFMGIPMPVQFAVWSTFPTHAFEMQSASTPYGQVDGVLNENYDYAPGTSAACPFVAALAGLYAQKNGITRATPNAPARLIQVLQRSSESLPNVNGGVWSPNGGWGRINALYTLQDTAGHTGSVGCIVGIVTSNQVPVSGARVTATQGATSVNATTAANGVFRIPNVGPGAWTVKVSTTTAVGSLPVSVVTGVDNFGADFTFPWPPGDVDHNSIVDIRDAVAALRMIAGTDPLDPDAVNRADIFPWSGTNGRTHGDGTFDINDAKAILRIAAGMAP